MDTPTSPGVSTMHCGDRIMEVLMNRGSFLIGVGIALAGNMATLGSAHAQGVRAEDPDLQATLERMDAAHIAFHNGNPEPSMAIWSHASDVTLTGGAGGKIEMGWDNVRPRLQWASAQYTRGRQQNERVRGSRTPGTLPSWCSTSTSGSTHRVRKGNPNGTIVSQPRFARRRGSGAWFTVMPIP